MDKRQEMKNLWEEVESLHQTFKGDEVDRLRAECLLNDIDKLELEIRAEDVNSKYGFRGNRNPIIKPDVGGYSVRSNGPFSTFGQQLQAIAHASRPGNEPDKKLYQVRAASGMSENIGADGGFLIAGDFSREIWKTAFNTGQILNLVRRIPIQSNSLKINAVSETSRVSTRWGGILGYWMAEAADKTASAPKFRQMELTLKKLVCLCYATDELLEDANMLETTIREGFAHEIAFQLDRGIISGSGVGQPLGILNSGCKISVARNTASSIKIQDVVTMWASLLPGSHANAVWLINADALPTLYQLSQTVGTQGFPVYMPAGGLSETPYNSLMGRPVIITEQCSSLGTIGDLILADFSQYILATRGETKFDSSIHVRFTNDETTFRAVTRCDGQPALNAAVTPAKGSKTLSHFIVLS